MDPICHTLVGAALAQTGLGKRSAYGAATLLIAANLPDVDAITMGMDGNLSLCVRRGWTHGVLAQAVLPLLLVGAVLLWHRLRRANSRPPPVPGQLVLLSYIGLLSHPFLDWLNNYGVRLLMPFDGRWFYGDALYIVDPWMWLLLGSAVFLGYSRGRLPVAVWGILAALTSALVLAASPSSLWQVKAIWIGWLLVLGLLRFRRVAQSGPARSRLARVMLASAGLYIAFMLGGTRYGRSFVTEELASRGIVVDRLMVGPLAGNPLVRDVVAQTPGGYRYGTLTFSPAPHFELAAPVIPLPPDTELVRRAFAAPEARGYTNWARFPFVEIEETGESYYVWISDARYSRVRGTGFGAWLVELPKQ